MRGDSTWDDEEGATAGASEPREPRARYEDRGPLGMGAMGEVRRVYDRVLQRTAAMKVLRADRVADLGNLDRFLHEGRASAVLQHPGIVPVYDAGVQADGRPYVVMREIAGETLARRIEVTHRDGTGLRRLVEVVVRAAEAVGYAHRHGTAHRDLKPANLMIGEFGEVMVVDWGLARAVSQPSRGAVSGTPVYMAPEQALGADADGARVDVYALGATLYHALAGFPPYAGEADDVAGVLACVKAGPPRALVSGAGEQLSNELLALMWRAMSRDPADRFADGLAFAEQLTAWLDGAHRRERARDLVDRATRWMPLAASLADDAGKKRATGRAALAAMPAWAPEGEKRPAWRITDHADRLQLEADRVRADVEQALHAALLLDPDSTPARGALLAIAREDHGRAEATGDRVGMIRAERAMRAHATALPADHEEALAAHRWLDAHDEIAVDTTPSGAIVVWCSVESIDGKSAAVRPLVVGQTPVRMRLPRGNHQLTLGGVRYPLTIDRRAPWSATPPGATGPAPVRIPSPDSLAANDCFVPAGWFACGHPEVPEGLAPRRVWVDDFAMQRFPVTVGEYLDFLNALVAHGRVAEAVAFVPRERAATGDGEAVFARDAEGRFVLQPDSDGDLWHRRWPVCMVDHASARAYAAWYAAQTGLAYRLPGELEWEKAARGVDGRLYPWGDRFDPSRCCMHDSHRARPTPATVDDYPSDVSPYGVRGLGGNVRDWCADAFTKDGPTGDRAAVPPDLVAGSAVIRGGSWSGYGVFTRAVVRYPLDVRMRAANLGFRLARSL